MILGTIFGMLQFYPAPGVFVEMGCSLESSPPQAPLPGTPTSPGYFYYYSGFFISALRAGHRTILPDMG
jgi:hypothetical protein